MKKELWVLPEYAGELLSVEKRMRQPHGALSVQQENGMSEPKIWTAAALFEALSATEQFSHGGAKIELLEGADPSLHLVMHEYGDLPLYLAVVGEQIVVEALLWPVAQVRDVVAFNDQVLRTQKLFPLSTVAIETLGDGEQAYIMFGALSASSTLSNVLFEIETLSDNVINATEAFEAQLRDSA